LLNSETKLNIEEPNHFNS